jgi:flagellar biosynthetic protein FliP
MNPLRVIMLLGLAGVLLGATGRAVAQSGNGSNALNGPRDDMPVDVDNPNAVPELTELLDIIDQATRPDEDDEEGWTAPVRLAIVFAFLALLPSLLVLMTSFTRIVIVLGFVRRAISTQSVPPTVAIIGLALFLTLFTMGPVFAEINAQAIEPYSQEKMPFEDAVEKASLLLKRFMLRQTREGDLELFIDMSEIPLPETQDDVPMRVAIPAFAISEFRTAFEIGCLLFIPFLLIDLVTGAVLLSAGMMMLPPALISLPFKIILFVLVDGWRLLAETLVMSFH